MLIQNLTDLDTAIANGPYVWPGGYPCFFLTSDGAALSFQSVLDNLEAIRESVAGQLRDGWCVVAFDINWEDPDLFCDHSGDRIESAYAEEV